MHSNVSSVDLVNVAFIAIAKFIFPRQSIFPDFIRIAKKITEEQNPDVMAKPLLCSSNTIL
jgi:hypothetical protein